MESKFLLGNRVELRPDSRGKFDELVVSKEVGCAYVHFEMMSDNQLNGAGWLPH